MSKITNDGLTRSGLWSRMLHRGTLMATVGVKGLIGDIMPVSDTDGELFHGVILQSGSALNPWAVVSNPDAVFRQLLSESATMFNCTELGISSYRQHQQTPLQHQLTDCLRQVPVDRLINTDLRASRYRSTVGPVLREVGLLTSDAQRLSMLPEARTLWPRIAVLLGFVSNEGMSTWIRRNV